MCIRDSDKEFLSKLWQHNKKMSAFHHEEKLSMISDVEELKISLNSLAKHVTELDPDSYKKTIDEAWSPRLEKALSNYLTGWGKLEDSDYVHPAQWIKLVGVYSSLMKLSNDYSSSGAAKVMADIQSMDEIVSQLKFGL